MSSALAPSIHTNRYIDPNSILIKDPKEIEAALKMQRHNWLFHIFGGFIFFPHSGSLKVLGQTVNRRYIRKKAILIRVCIAFEALANSGLLLIVFYFRPDLIYWLIAYIIWLVLVLSLGTVRIRACRELDGIDGNALIAYCTEKKLKLPKMTQSITGATVSPAVVAPAKNEVRQSAMII